MISLATSGITSFSIKPIQIIFGFGSLLTSISALITIVLIILSCVGKTKLGINILLCSMFFIGGLIILRIGIFGEYLGKTYLEKIISPSYCI